MAEKNIIDVSQVEKLTLEKLDYLIYMMGQLLAENVDYEEIDEDEVTLHN